MDSSSQSQATSSQTSIGSSQTSVSSLANVTSDCGGEIIEGAPQGKLGSAQIPVPATAVKSHERIEASKSGLPKAPGSPKSEPAKSRLVKPELRRSQSHTIPSKRSQDYFANRRRASFVIHDECGSAPILSCLTDARPDNPKCIKLSPSRTLKRATSSVRLSLSVDGKAEVSTGIRTSPSPPQSRPSLGLQRSYSALEPSVSKDIMRIPTKLNARRPMTGRSRDARTWEFYCDADARNALTEQAEREEKGSAAAAISLIRSSNNVNRISPANPNKREAHLQKRDDAKRIKADNTKRSKAPLGRATSSVARMQTTNGNIQKQADAKLVKETKLPKSGSQITEAFYGDDDSDKENWVPGTQSSNPRRRRSIKTQGHGRILEESMRFPSQSSNPDPFTSRGTSISGHSSHNSSSYQNKENSGPQVDDEVANFMGATATREVEDLDCVQNLLSLSQAAWQ